MSKRSFPADKETLDVLRQAHDAGRHDDLTYWGTICPDCYRSVVVKDILAALD